MYDILIAIILDWLIGDPYWFPHPIKFIGKLIKTLEDLGRKYIKSNRAMRLFGGLIVIIVSFLCFIIPFIILQLLKPIPILFHFINIILIWTTIAAAA